MKNSLKISKEKFWKDHIQRFVKSGQSRRQYCQVENLSYWSFRDWQKKIEITPEEKLVKVSRRFHPQKNDEQTSIEILVADKVSIRIPRSFDGQLLRDVLNELGVTL